MLGYTGAMRATWRPHEKHGRLTTQSDLPDSVYAFPKQRKEPLTDARHVRNAIARLDQVEGVSAADRDLAFANIKKAAKHYDVDLSETSAADVGVRPHSARAKRAAVAGRARARKAAGTTRKKATSTRKKTTATRKKATSTRKKATSTRKKTATRKKATAARKKTTRKKTTRRKA